MTNQTSQFPGPAWGPPPKAGAWSRLTPMQRVGVLLAAPLLLCCGGVTMIGAFGDDSAPPGDVPAASDRQIAEIGPTEEPAPDSAEAATEPTIPPATEPATGATAAGPVADEPVVEKRTVTERKTIKFSTRTVKDSSMDKGKSKVRTKGAAGVRTLTYEVTLTDGVETGRRLLTSVVTKKPVAKVVAVGTRTKSSSGGCNPNYRPCVPIASDVDCAGGGGNGPKYVDGPIRVIGSDPYDLDRDGDGIACDD